MTGPPGRAASRLEGASALVTGASRGIGRAVAIALAREGARLLVSARDGTALEAVARETGAEALPADLEEPTEVDRLAGAVRTRLAGAPDLLVNAAGVFALAPAHRTDPATFERHLAVNLAAPFRLVRAFLPAMLERGSGRLVHLGSVAGREPFPENAAYGASKYGLRGLHEVLRTELAGTGVASLLVEPGPVDTGAWDPLEERLGGDLPPREAMLRPEQVAEAVLALLRLGEGARSEILLLPA